jgi:hypothetical protein
MKSKPYLQITTDYWKPRAALFLRWDPLARVLTPRFFVTAFLSRSDEMGLGKCWGKDTPMLLYDGTTKPVQHIVAGDRLMGDDGTPRTVQAGSIIIGHTAKDGADAATYRITNQNKGKLSWTCNADHILVLKFNVRPCKVLKDPRPGLTRPYYYNGIARNAQNVVVRTHHSFATQVEANESHERATADWTPLIWEGSVNEYLKFGQAIRQLARLYQPSDPLPFQSSAPSLQQRLTAAYAAHGQAGRQATKEEAELTAWVIGMWLMDGHANRPEISQIALDAKRPDHSHTAVILQLEDWYSKVYGVPVSSGVAADGQPIASPSARPREDSPVTWPIKISTAGNMVYDIRLGPIMRKLLESYGILDEKYVPTELLADTPAVRWQLLAGVVDGDGYANPDRLIEVAAKERRFVEGLVHLARGLGFSTGEVGEKRCTNEDTGEVYKGFRVNIGGENLHKIQTALLYKRFSPRPPSKANKDQSCDGFKVEKVDHANYYGFTLDGNGRCLLGDFTVSHNVRTKNKSAHAARLDCRKRGIALRSSRCLLTCLLIAFMKTVSVVAHLLHLRSVYTRGPFLVIVPLSTLPHWKREFDTWSNLNSVIFQGNKEDRDMVKNYEWNFWQQEERGQDGGDVVLKDVEWKFDVLLCTYESVLAETTFLSRVPWKICVVDVSPPNSQMRLCDCVAF